MLGFDSLWRHDFADAELKRLSITEQRYLLTRDRELAENADPLFTYYVQATDPNDQLKEVLEYFALLERVRSRRGFLTRCLECNHVILPVRGDQIAERIPAAVRQEHEEFFLCTYCERVYWKGSHFDRMQKWVEDLIREL